MSLGLPLTAGSHVGPCFVVSRPLEAAEGERVRLRDQLRDQPRVEREVRDQLAGALRCRRGTRSRWRCSRSARSVNLRDRATDRVRRAGSRLPRRSPRSMRPSRSRNDCRARYSLMPESKSKLSPDAPVHQPACHCWKVRAEQRRALGRERVVARPGSSCGVGAKDSGTTMRSGQLHASAEAVVERVVAEHEADVAAVVGAVDDVGCRAASPGTARRPSSARRRSSTACVRAAAAGSRSRCSSRRGSRPRRRRCVPVSVYAWLPTPCAALASAAVKL